MRYGFVMPFGDARQIADAAVLAEESGWDAVFAWEAVWGVDAWVALTAAASVTERIRLGTMLTPLPRLRPWDLAGKVATLDHYSGGRVQLAVGLGALHEGWLAFERDQGRRTRVELLEEGLAVYDGLMRGQPFEFTGEHYQVSPTTFLPPPPPLQQPRVPVWVVGVHVADREAQPSVERAARWDGIIPAWLTAGQDVEPDAPFTPDNLATIVARCRAVREDAALPVDGFEVTVEGTSHGPSPTPDRPSVWREVGATWWLEGAWDLVMPALGGGPVTGQQDETSGPASRLAELRRRIRAGPPRD